MQKLAKEDVYSALEPLVTADQGKVTGVQINGGHVSFTIEVDPKRGTELETLRQNAEHAITQLAGVEKVTAVLTAEKQVANDPHGMNKNPRLELPIKHIIAVASGKGGVGKSTIAFNLARALSATGLSAGLLDADIYGPSVPTLAGLKGQKPKNDNGRIQPLTAHDLKIMSIGFMVEEEAPMIWRGPMVQTAIYQMLRDVDWGTNEEPLDVLIVDMPPGTGDAQLTMAQKVPLAGAIIVSTPQDLALIDARKGIEMFEKVGMPVLGLIENMSIFTCPECGHESHIFGHHGAQEEAKKRNIPFLGSVPLNMAIREAADSGRPITDNFCDDIATQILDRL